MADLEKRTTYVRLGKFDSARDSALYDMSSDALYDGSGNAEAPTGWFTPITVTADELRDWVTSAYAWETPGFRDMVESRETFDTLIGNFMVSGDERGAVYVETFDTANALTAEFESRDAAYSRWECPWAIVEDSDGGVVERFEDEDEARAQLGTYGAGFSVVNTEES